MAAEGFAALLPAMRLEIPFARLAGVAGLDAGVGIEQFELRELRRQGQRALGNLGLAVP